LLRVTATDVVRVVADVMTPANRVVLTFLPAADDEEAAA
jgi:hypothetical protein